MPTEITVHAGPFRYLAIHMNEATRQRARDLWTTSEFKYPQRQRKKVEALFAELKSHLGLHRLCLRRLKFVRGAFLPGGHCPEHQATGPFPQPAYDATGTYHCKGTGKVGTD